MAKSPCRHVRSASFPSVSHPLMSKIEKKLKELRGDWGALSSSSPSSLSHRTVESLCNGLTGLADLLESIEKLLQPPFACQAASALVVHGQQPRCKWVDEVLNGSLTLLDVSGTIRDVLLQMKEQVHGIQSALRRRKNIAEFHDLESSIVSYMSCRKTMSKVIPKCMSHLKRMEKKHGSSLSGDDSHEIVVVAGILREVEGLSLIILDSLLSFIAGPRAAPAGWPLVSKLMHNRRVLGVACDGQNEDYANEVEKVDAALCGLVSGGRRSSSCKDNEAVAMQDVQKWLKVLEMSVGALEDRLECLFRHLIKTRVSLLNILSQ
ncbi:PREDICTED: uncharacterized protein LOC104587096 [Nelumbo nucifera]|uniref:Protein BPS1, chloroplastic-like n=2 Tax=Nelumbo nucifera TaxID=4432 RepID=A0A822ZXG4_NELNU|nr:PREDICTED: uncharacterized protein LOC104587096 [Nelumbo nucifera]DAD46588.1 TPA_asm: hypothetical protein HUJ06_016525 [Nelumbo nucifera]